VRNSAVAIFPFLLLYLLIPVIDFGQPVIPPSPAVFPSGDLSKGLFDSDEILNIKLSGDIRKVLNDRGEDPKYHPLSLSYSTADSTKVSIPVQVKTRGHFRKDKTNCNYPPLLLNVSKKNQPVTSIFYEQDKLKLVMPCKGDEYIIREWLVYKLYNLISPLSFKARLVRVMIEDEAKKKTTTFFGMLLEEEEQMARRNKMASVKKIRLNPQSLVLKDFLAMTVFQYMIGNTDWSVQYLHNIKMVATDSVTIPVAVPYDFDHAGIVYAPYAFPSEGLELQSVQERRYRGYCIPDMKTFDETIALFNQRKKDVYETYTRCSLLDARYIKTATQYLDDFYKIINNPKSLRKEFGYPCDNQKTSTVVIKGLTDD
jgi:hypothetical protein